LAALLVLLFHYTTRYDDIFGHVGDYPINLPWAGIAGVTIFFSLSGYFAAVGLQKKINPIKFLVKKLVRLYPVYWVAIIVTFITITFLLSERSIQFKDMVVNFTMFQSLLGFSSVDGAYWTQIYDLIFYIDIFLIICIGLRKKADIVVLCWSLLMLLPEIFSALNYVPWSYFYKVANPFLLWGYGHIFAAGAALYFILCGNIRSRILSSFSLIFCLTRQVLHDSTTRLVSLVIALIIIALSTIAQNYGIVPSNRILKLLKPLTSIASVSYPLYLIHQNCGYVIIKYMEKIGLTNEIFLIIPIGVMITVAWLMSKFIEKPVMKFFDRILNKFKS
jgi:peptidoglycan/LPS O-acetylase OafA/YrhL